METIKRTTKDPYATTLHRDGTVTLWDVYSQSWKRLNVCAISDRTMATLSGRERDRIERMRHNAQAR